MYGHMTRSHTHLLLKREKGGWKFPFNPVVHEKVSTKHNDKRLVPTYFYALLCVCACTYDLQTFTLYLVHGTYIYLICTYIPTNILSCLCLHVHFTHNSYTSCHSHIHMYVYSHNYKPNTRITLHTHKYFYYHFEHTPNSCLTSIQSSKFPIMMIIII
jgi:hypothetical protein